MIGGRRTSSLGSVAPLALLAALCGCGDVDPVATGPAAGALADVLPPGIRGFDLYDDAGALWALAAAPQDGFDAIFCARSDDGGATWRLAGRVDDPDRVPHRPSIHAAPQIVARGDRVLAIVARGDRVLAIWTVSGSGFMGRGPMVAAASDDGGQSWRPAADPHAQESRGGQSFVDLARTPDGAVHAVWLGKEKAGRGVPKGLFHTSTKDFGASWATPVAVDAETCECCWNRLVVGDSGALAVLYRDVNPRDMAVASLTPQGWQRRGTAGAFGWDFDGCPHVGGGLVAAAGGAVHAVVWTGKEEVGGAYYCRANGQGAFSDPLPLGSGQAVHADLVRGADGVLIAVWDAREDAGDRVYVRASRDDGVTWSEPRPLSTPGSSATAPKIVAGAEVPVVVWIERAAQDDACLRVARLTEDVL